jgi:hypothetical protein
MQIKFSNQNETEYDNEFNWRFSKTRKKKRTKLD